MDENKIASIFEVPVKFPNYVNKNYKTEVQRYRIIDGLLALLIIPIFIFSIVIEARLIRYFNAFYFASAVTTIIMVLTIFIIMRKRKQGKTSLGFAFENKNWLKSGIVGIIISLSFFIPINITWFIQWINDSMRGSLNLHLLFFSLIHLFLFVGFMEEFVFRGYIQSRLYGVIRNDKIAIFIGSFIFVILHPISDIIVTMILTDMYYMTMFSAEINIFHFNRSWDVYLLMFIIAIILNTLYRKYNSLIGPIILHGFINFPHLSRFLT